MTATERDRDLAWDLLLDAPQLTGEDRERAVRILAEAIAAERVRVRELVAQYIKKVLGGAGDMASKEYEDGYLDALDHVWELIGERDSLNEYHNPPSMTEHRHMYVGCWCGQ